MNMRTHYKIINNLKNLVTIISKNKIDFEKKIVLTNGCYDIIHAGHIHLLEKAKAFGDILVVAINSDKSIKRIKGENRPIVPQDQRALVIAALGCVDFVYIFDEDTPYELIHFIKPDVLIKGGDWTIENIVGGDVVTAIGGKVVSVPVEIETSTTKIISNILNTYRINDA